MWTLLFAEIPVLVLAVYFTFQLTSQYEIRAFVVALSVLCLSVTAFYIAFDRRSKHTK